VSEPLLHLDGVEVAYHRAVTAVQGVSLKVPEGGVVALLGTNGAGKTTTLRAISGFIGLDDARVTDGAIRFAGARIENQPPHRLTARGIALVPERSKVFENLTVEENLQAVVPRAGADHRRLKAAVYALFPALAPLRGREAGYLSGGERQMLAIGSALACAPRRTAAVVGAASCSCVEARARYNTGRFPRAPSGYAHTRAASRHRRCDPGE